MAGRWGEEKTGEETCEKPPGPLESGAVFLCCSKTSRTSCSVSRDVSRKSRLGREGWRCEPNEVVADVRSDEREVESWPQSTPSKGDGGGTGSRRVDRGDGCGAGLPCRLGIRRCFPNTLDALVEVSGSGVLGGRLRRSRSSLLLKRNSRLVLFR